MQHRGSLAAFLGISLAFVFGLAGVPARAGAADPPAPKPSSETKPATGETGKAEGVKGMDITFSSGKETIGGYLTRPAGDSPRPAVIVIHEWWGLNDEIRRLSDRLAGEGYVVLAPDLYRGKVGKDPESAHELMRGLPENRATADVAAAVARLRSLPGMSRAKIGVVGFCMGGRLSLLSALGSKEFAACAIFYGRPETDPATLKTLACPVLGIFGGADQGIGPDQVDPFREGLGKAGVAHEVKVYEGAGHAFMNETGRNFHPAAAKDAWGKMTAFFAKNLKT